MTGNSSRAKALKILVFAAVSIGCAIFTSLVTLALLAVWSAFSGALHEHVSVGWSGPVIVIAFSGGVFATYAAYGALRKRFCKRTEDKDSPESE